MTQLEAFLVQSRSKVFVHRESFEGGSALHVHTIGRANSRSPVPYFVKDKSNLFALFGLKAGFLPLFQPAERLAMQQENNGQLIMESPGPAFPLKTTAKVQVPAVDEDADEQRLAAMVCSLENKDECLMCGS